MTGNKKFCVCRVKGKVYANFCIECGKQFEKSGCTKCKDTIISGADNFYTFRYCDNCVRDCSIKEVTK